MIPTQYELELPTGDGKNPWAIKDHRERKLCAFKTFPYLVFYYIGFDEIITWKIVCCSWYFERCNRGLDTNVLMVFRIGYVPFLTVLCALGLPKLWGVQMPNSRREIGLHFQNISIPCLLLRWLWWENYMEFFCFAWYFERCNKGLDTNVSMAFRMDMCLTSLYLVH